MFSLLACLILCKVSLCYGLTAEVTVDWTNTIAISKSHTTLQVVVNALLTRQSPIYEQAYKSLNHLNASYVRYVPWYPYPRLGVAQLEPSSGQYLCGHLNGNSNHNNWTLTLKCPTSNSTVSAINFASWGTPTGYCGNFTLGKCHANNSVNIAATYCLNKNNCSIPVNNETFNGDPCKGTIKRFDIQLTCNVPYNYSNWNFDLVDPLMEDFMNAVNPNNESNRTVINFSTIPNWKYMNVTYGDGLVDNPYDTSSYNQGLQLVDPTGNEIGKYYADLINYYKNGGFIDEYGNKYDGHYYNIDLWEVLNEPNSEHKNTPQSYTLLYDAIVSNIQKYADPKKTIKFMGLAYAGRSMEWYEYFLNHSNHKPSTIPIDYISFHFYARCQNRTDPTNYQTFFPAVDDFIIFVNNVTKIRDKFSPNTMLSIDEIGVILPQDKTPGSPDPPPIYWNAAAAEYAYLFPQLAIQGIDIIGESQLTGILNYDQLSESFFPASPGGISVQHASVTMLDWETGLGNARYWVLKLLIDHFNIGDKLVKTIFSETSSFYAQGFISNNLNEDKKILIVNKLYSNITVNFNGFNDGGKLYVIDQESYNGPAYIYEIYSTEFNMRPYGVAIFYPN